MANQSFDFAPDFRPLAARMRPLTLDDYVGQEQLLGPGKPLRDAIERGQLHSMILWGPPGTGKTTLAEIIAQSGAAAIERVSAVTSGVKEIRAAIAKAKENQQQGRRTLLFVDEVHRFNKSQQDAFLPHIEDGTVVFIGATTENPAFELNGALLSRARVYRLKALDDAAIRQLLELALTDSERGLGERALQLTAEALDYLVHAAGGDARRALNYLEISADTVADGEPLERAMVVEAIGGRQTGFDKQGDVYYDLLSALHKSVRGSSADGALYWYARILQGGGDPLIVARRLLAIASEDIGNADPRAIQLALNAWDTFHRVGPAEGERAIAQALVYCALAAKSNAVYRAFSAAKKLAADYPDAPVPHHLRNAPTKVHKQEGFGDDYRYAHDFPNAIVAGERYLPSVVGEVNLYQPSDRGLEKQLKAKLDWLQQHDQQSNWQRGDDHD
ncbi:recombination factor protein RarA [Pseudidiomarina aquimaris]|uniref:Replication-associated recombination protein A n=1 Tax=Pseudidiomarina aquimaris TaxID=641841 RepID=A0A432XQ09_9GAMM|nr:replication-associated recombination protein A [Pseudidiomarina aquimaris]RUO50790.1 recombination factor protein RarA [Pseudidiomarina aquimaris]